MPKRITKGNLWGLIQSRPYASVSDIRRLFLIETDSAVPVATSEGTYYIGLPPEAAEVVAQLWREGRIVLDVNPDIKGRVVQGLFPARSPSSRQFFGPSGAPAPQWGQSAPSSAISRGDAAAAGADAAAEPARPPGSSKRRRRRKHRSAG